MTKDRLHLSKLERVTVLKDLPDSTSPVSANLEKGLPGEDVETASSIHKHAMECERTV